jgi:hypothetical protein
MCLGRGNVDLNVRSRQTFASRSEDRKWPIRDAPLCNLNGRSRGVAAVLQDLLVHTTLGERPQPVTPRRRPFPACRRSIAGLTVVDEVIQ